MAPAVLLVLLVFLYPIIYGFFISLHADTPLQPERPFVGFDIYADLIDSDRFQNAIIRSLIFVVGTITTSTLLALVFALLLYYTPTFKRLLRSISLIPWLISGVAVAWLFRLLFNAEVGLVDPVLAPLGLDYSTWLGNPTRAMIVVVVANTWYLVPFGTLIMLAGLQVMDVDLFDAAKVDGVNARQMFRYITLPQLLPHLALALIVISFSAWNTFDLVLAMTGGGPRASTEVLAVFMYKRAFEAFAFSEGAAIMIVILLINVSLSLFYFRILRHQDQG